MGCCTRRRRHLAAVPLIALVVFSICNSVYADSQLPTTLQENESIQNSRTEKRSSPSTPEYVDSASSKPKEVPIVESQQATTSDTKPNNEPVVPSEERNIVVPAHSADDANAVPEQVKTENLRESAEVVDQHTTSEETLGEPKMPPEADAFRRKTEAASGESESSNTEQKDQQPIVASENAANSEPKQGERSIDESTETRANNEDPDTEKAVNSDSGKPTERSSSSDSNRDTATNSQEELVEAERDEAAENTIDFDGVDKSSENETTADSEPEEGERSVDESTETRTSKDDSDTEKAASSGSDKPPERSSSNESSREAMAADDTAKTATGEGQPSTETATEPKPGSLASFFNKVSSDGSSFAAANEYLSTRQAPPEPVIDEDYPKPYCGVWGVYQWERRRADLSILFLLFQDLFLAEAENLGLAKEMQPDKVAEKLTEEANAQDKVVPPLESKVKTEPIKPKSVNDVFVEGLDDLDKFFEDVEPPDELDVGAGGSSIQEVLMGQGSRIIIKRITMGAKFVQKMAVTTKDSIVRRWKEKDIKFDKLNKEDMGRMAKVAGTWILENSKRLFHAAQELVDRLFEGDELDDEDIANLDFQFTPPGAETRDTGEQEIEMSEEMKELLRRQMQGQEAR